MKKLLKTRYFCDKIKREQYKRRKSYERKIEKTYDYSRIKKINGTILEITANNDLFYFLVRFEDESNRKIYAGNRRIVYPLEEEISVYTDGKFYELTEELTIYKSSNIRFYDITQIVEIFSFFLLYIPYIIISIILKPRV